MLISEGADLKSGTAASEFTPTASLTCQGLSLIHNHTYGCLEVTGLPSWGAGQGCFSASAQPVLSSSPWQKALNTVQSLIQPCRSGVTLCRPVTNRGHKHLILQHFKCTIFPITLFCVIRASHRCLTEMPPKHEAKVTEIIQAFY